MTITNPRRITLSVLLGLEAIALVLAITLFLVPWSTTFSEFENRPITTGQAYLESAPWLLLLAGVLATLVSLWLRNARAARILVFTIAALHGVSGVVDLAQIGGAFGSDYLYSATVKIGYAIVLVAILGRLRRRPITRSRVPA